MPVRSLTVAVPYVIQNTSRHIGTARVSKRTLAFFSTLLNYYQHTENVIEGKLLAALWREHFSQRADELRVGFPDALHGIKLLYFESGWASVYDFIEFIANFGIEAKLFVAECNRCLERHVSAYRFVGTKLAPITSDEEIAAVAEAESFDGRFAPASVHIKTALSHLADRANPDYRNSIKESISAVEATCQIVTGDTKTTLGPALRTLGIHPALEKGFSAIYGYTSDAQGIRHALSGESEVDADDAKFFLVACSAFVNYLIAKSAATPEAS